MIGWQLAVLPALSAWVAVLESDAVLVGQWMLSRPLFLGPLVGLVCGHLQVGLALGVMTELFSVESLPVGTAMPLNAPVAAGCAALLSAGPWGVPMPASFVAGLGLGAAHQWLEARIRHWRGAMTVRAAQTLGEGQALEWRGLLLRSVGAHVGATAAFVYVAVSGLGPALSWLWDALPAVLRDALGFAFDVGPWLGLAALVRGFLRKA